MNSAGDSARTFLLILVASFTLLFGTALAKCPPGSLQDAFVGVHVAGTTQPSDDAYNPSLAVTYDGLILIAFEGLDTSQTPDRREIMAAVFSSAGVLQGSVIPLTAFDDDPDLSALGQLKSDPTVAIDGSIASVAFLGVLDKGYYATGFCDFETPCEALYCNTASCEFEEIFCTFETSKCRYPVDSVYTLASQFTVGTTPNAITVPIVLGRRLVNRSPSASRSTFSGTRLAWANSGSCGVDAPFGWMTGIDWDNGNPIRGCMPYACDNNSTAPCAYDVADLQPCIAQRSDGYSVVAWADPEVPGDVDSNMNIQLRLLDPNGTTRDQFWVNDTGTGIIEPDPSSQVSPAVAIDDSEFANGPSNVVVTWVGPPPPGVPCFTCPTIYARRFVVELGNNPPTTAYLRDPNPAAGEGIKNDFIVNNQVGTVPADYSYTSPTVALSAETGHRGRFIIAWNSQAPPSFSGDEIHGQYFDTDGRPMGCEFRMTKNFSNSKSRILSASARHTVAYSPNGDVALAYTKKDVNSETNKEVWLTIIPDGTADTLDASVACCKGDVNFDGLVNGRDIFDGPENVSFKILLFLENPQVLNIVQLCPADTDSNGVLDVDDIAPFVTLLLEGAECGGSPSRGIADCNANGIPDANDIADGTSQDCTHNFIPDECDINVEDPDGNELVSPDVDENDVPDECQPDCNVNSRPDSADIACGGGNTCGAIAGSYDANSNDIPDECEKDCNENGRPDDLDITCGGGNTCNSLAGSYDCNADGTPDECEADCNENGVPDDCDIDPLDPDGNEEVSDDCNDDGMPDECNMALPPPYGSFDCNENGALDECDIASEYSEDANENGVPDECEEEELRAAPNGGLRMGHADSKALADGDGETPGVSTMIQGPSEETWEAFYEWSFSQCWGLDCEATTGEQFQAYVNKLTELGMTMP